MISCKILFLFKLICALPCNVIDKRKQQIYFLYGSEHKGIWGAATQPWMQCQCILEMSHSVSATTVSQGVPSPWIISLSKNTKSFWRGKDDEKWSSICTTLGPHICYLNFPVFRECSVRAELAFFWMPFPRHYYCLIFDLMCILRITT